MYEEEALLVDPAVFEAGIPMLTSTDISNFAWRATGKSIRGASHLRSGLPNQDAIGWEPESVVMSDIVLAVADGHGSPRYFRSEVGARLAVQAAISECGGLGSITIDLDEFELVERKAKELLPDILVQHWQQLVSNHLSHNPILRDELEALEKARGAGERQSVERSPLICYGATVLAALITHRYILYLQLGDGDILRVTETGEVARPVSGDKRLIANETTSLCLPTAPRDFRFALEPLVDNKPALIMLSTDGYVNSFVDDAAFCKVASDVLQVIRHDGFKIVSESLEAWLNEASKSGSGDDITVGVIYRDRLHEE